METPIPTEVRELVRTRVRSMDHVEVLMRLHQAAGNPVVSSELQRMTHLDDRTFATVVGDLVRGGLVTLDPMSESYRSAPATLADRKAVNALALAYHQQPMNLVKLVYTQPAAPLQSFSDAFRLREPKDKKNE